MSRITITKLEQDPRGFWTANVSDGTDTVKVDNRIGPWTTPVDPSADHGSNRISRREVIPAVSTKLRAKVRAAERGERQDDESIEVVIERGGGTRNLPKPKPAPEPEPTSTPETTVESIARLMAEAGAAAVKEAA